MESTEEQNMQPELADVIVKIQNSEPLTFMEGKIYCEYARSLSREEAEALLSMFQKQYGKS